MNTETSAKDIDADIIENKLYDYIKRLVWEHPHSRENSLNLKNKETLKRLRVTYLLDNVSKRFKKENARFPIPTDEDEFENETYKLKSDLYIDIMSFSLNEHDFMNLIKCSKTIYGTLTNSNFILQRISICIGYNSRVEIIHFQNITIAGIRSFYTNSYTDIKECATKIPQQTTHLDINNFKFTDSSFFFTLSDKITHLSMNNADILSGIELNRLPTNLKYLGLNDIIITDSQLYQLPCNLECLFLINLGGIIGRCFKFLPRTLKKLNMELTYYDFDSYFKDLPKNLEYFIDDESDSKIPYIEKNEIEGYYSRNIIEYKLK